MITKLNKNIIFICFIVLLFTSCNGSSGTNDETSQNSSNEEKTEVLQDSTDESENNVDSDTEESEIENSDTVIEEPKRNDFGLNTEDDKFVNKISESLTLTNIRDNNQIEDNGEKALLIQLPPSYYESNANYPVVYFFHGFGGSENSIYNYLENTTSMMEEGLLKEMIIVSVSQYNKYSGSFMTNSPVTGNWEDAFTQEVIPYIDSNYNTIGTKEGRALTGFSMGGYSVLHLGLTHPDLFNAIYAISPGLLIDEEFDMAMDSWDRGFLHAYGAAFCPQPDQDPNYLVPQLDGSDLDNDIIDSWLNGFGHMEQKIKDYQSHTNKLEGIGLEVATNDSYIWITNGTTYFSDLLTSNNIEHQFSTHTKGHTFNSQIFNENSLTYLQQFLDNN